MSMVHKIKKQFRLVVAWSKKNKFVLLGLLAVSFLYLGSAGVISVTTPWFRSNGDTIYHIDYTWRFYNGDIPRYSQGITYPNFVDMGVTKFQQASANPPLFYAIHAPVIGPLLNEGKWEEAIALGSALNLFIGLLCVAVLAWAGWLYGGTRKELFAVAVPALSALMYWFLRLNRDYALDVLVVLLATLAFIVMHKLLHKGPKLKYLSAITLISAAGMLTKASYVVILFVSLLAVLASYVISAQKIKRTNIVRGMIAGSVVFIVVLMLSAWFYYFWNYQTSGQWFRSFDNGVSSRPFKTLTEVVTSPLIWALLYARYAVVPVISTAILSFAIAGYLAMRGWSLKSVLQNKATSLAILALALVYVLTFATQVVHAVGYGSINFRYLLPALFPMALFLAYGLLEFRRARGQLVAIAAILMAGTTLLSVKVSLTNEKFLDSIDRWLEGLPKIVKAGAANSVPPIFTKGLILMFVVGAIILPIAMFVLSKKTEKLAK